LKGRKAYFCYFCGCCRNRWNSPGAPSGSSARNLLHDGIPIWSTPIFPWRTHGRDLMTPVKGQIRPPLNSTEVPAGRNVPTPAFRWKKYRLERIFREWRRLSDVSIAAPSTDALKKSSWCPTPVTQAVRSAATRSSLGWKTPTLPHSSWSNVRTEHLHEAATCRQQANWLRLLDIRKHLQQVSIGIAEEQRAMSKDLVGWRREQIDALPHEFVGAPINLGSGNLEGQL
jgi:hypothetical protein